MKNVTGFIILRHGLGWVFKNLLTFSSSAFLPPFLWHRFGKTQMQVEISGKICLEI